MPTRCVPIIAAVIATTIFAGCSSTPGPKAASDEDKVYVTGSRLPRHGAGTVQMTEDKNQIHDAMQPRPGTGGTSGSN